MAASVEKLNRRALSKEVRRRELIDATIKCIARKGLGNTTLADVAREAGLSQGIVNLHFKSKDNLLAETLKSVADEYHEQFIIDDLPEGGHLSADGVTIYGGNRTITRPSRLSSSIPPVIAIRKTESVIRTRISS